MRVKELLARWFGTPTNHNDVITPAPGKITAEDPEPKQAHQIIVTRGGDFIAPEGSEATQLLYSEHVDPLEFSHNWGWINDAFATGRMYRAPLGGRDYWCLFVVVDDHHLFIEPGDWIIRDDTGKIWVNYS